MNRRIEIGTLALCIAFFPPVWAVIAPYLDVSTGGVALICAGLMSQTAMSERTLTDFHRIPPGRSVVGDCNISDGYAGLE